MGDSDEEDAALLPAVLKRQQTSSYAQLTRRGNILDKLLNQDDIGIIEQELPLLREALDAAIDAHGAYAEAVMEVDTLTQHEVANYETRVRRARNQLLEAKPMIDTLRSRHRDVKPEGGIPLPATVPVSPGSLQQTPAEESTAYSGTHGGAQSHASPSPSAPALPGPSSSHPDPVAPDMAPPQPTALNPQASAFQPETRYVQPEIQRLLEAIALPHPEVEKFGGDVTKYRQFIAAFEACIGSRTWSDRDRLYYLEQHLEG